MNLHLPKTSVAISQQSFKMEKNLSSWGGVLGITEHREMHMNAYYKIVPIVESNGESFSPLNFMAFTATLKKS